MNNAWLIRGDDDRIERLFHGIVVSESSASSHGILEGDLLFLHEEREGRGLVVTIGRVYRMRTNLDSITFLFDAELDLENSVVLNELELEPDDSTWSTRIEWSKGVSLLQSAGVSDPESIPSIEDHAYIRGLLQVAITDDLLGPANGPHEQIVDMSVRDRYLVGKLAPMESNRGGIEGLEGPLMTEGVEGEPEDLLVHEGRHDPGAEFDSTTGKVDAESEAGDEIDSTSNQSLVPSGFGITFCVDGDVERIELEARWGRYERVYDHEITKTRVNKETGKEEEIKAKAWQRIPCGGTFVLDLKEGIISHRAPDPENPEVRIQGTVRGRNAKGDRLVTLFLVNGQQEPEENKDSAWLFQPELIVRATDDAPDPAIFRKRPLLDERVEDERAALEMVYRNRVEFAVGHGVSVHSETSPDRSDHAMEIRSVVIPQYELPVTETPGMDSEDRPAMRRMIKEGYLDMERLAELERGELVEALSILTDDYAAWITEQRDRIGADVVGHDDQAELAIGRCEKILARLREGLSVLESNDDALDAFRLANRAMARQRIHSMYALARRRGEVVKLGDFDQRKNRSWRPFQLAFVLLSIPSVADPSHPDRTEPVEAFADLLWFPTGGGKTEAYLGVAAFTMFVRRLQGDLGGYDGRRGLSVIMRYTLRLLTLQQFQRATTLICAMEVLRREMEAAGEDRLGPALFTIGLWVGNRVTPGSTEESHAAIRDIRDPDKWEAGASSPAQFTSCPWCGSEIDPKRDIEVDRARLRTTIYCGDKKGRCAFSKGGSAEQPHPGIPALVVDEEIYRRPPSMMIATVDKFAMMAWRGETRTLFGIADRECPQHGLLWPDAPCTGNHRESPGRSAQRVAAMTKAVRLWIPPKIRLDPRCPISSCVIQDEFHLISGPLGTMVGLTMYETAVDELCEGPGDWMARRYDPRS